MSRDSPYGVPVADADEDEELVEVGLFVIVPVAVAVDVSVAVAVAVEVSVAVLVAVDVSVCVSLVPVPLTVSVADLDTDVVAEVDFVVEVVGVEDFDLDVVADEVVEDVIDEVAVAVALAVEVVSTLMVCASSARGTTSQLVPSEIASSAPPIFSLAVPKPMLSAVRLLKTTKPSSEPSTHIFTSARSTNSTQLPLLTSDAAGSVNQTSSVAPRVINTEPKSAGVTV